MDQLTLVSQPEKEFAYALQLRSEDSILHQQFQYAYRTAITKYGIEVCSIGVGIYSIIEFDEIDYMKIREASSFIAECIGLKILLV